MIEKIIKNARLSLNGRKLLTSDEKVYIVDSWESSGLSAPEFCRRYGLTTPQLYTWRKNSKRGAIMGIKNKGDVYSKAEITALKKENEELKLALAEAELYKRVLKKKLEMDEMKNQKSKQLPKNFRLA